MQTAAAKTAEAAGPRLVLETADGQTFTVPAFDAPAAVFGADAREYLTREQMGSDFYAMRGKHCDAADGLFFSGGKLSDHGLRFRAEIDQRAAMMAVRAWLSSFAPKHEIKIGTVGYALSKWCEPTA